MRLHEWRIFHVACSFEVIENSHMHSNLLIKADPNVECKTAKFPVI